MKSTAFLMSAAAVIGILATTPTVSSAAETKYYPGIQCHPERGTQLTQFVWGETRLDSNSNSTTVVRCPVIKDEEGSTDGANFQVRVRVQTAGQTVRCRAFSFDKFGSVASAETGQFTAPATVPANGEIVLENVNISTADGYYVIRCQLPPRASIYSYGVEEN
jgi:hypothetical protein